MASLFLKMFKKGELVKSATTSIGRSYGRIMKKRIKLYLEDEKEDSSLKIGGVCLDNIDREETVKKFRDPVTIHKCGKTMAVYFCPNFSKY